MHFINQYLKGELFKCILTTIEGVTFLFIRRQGRHHGEIPVLLTAMFCETQIKVCLLSESLFFSWGISMEAYLYQNFVLLPTLFLLLIIAVSIYFYEKALIC